MRLLFFEDTVVPDEIVEEVVEEVTEVTQTIVQCGCNTDSVVAALGTVSDKLDIVATKLDTVTEHLVTLEKGCTTIINSLSQNFPNVVAFLLILAGFEIMRLVKGWYNPIGGKKNGRFH